MVLAPDRPEIADTLGWLMLEHGDAQRGLVILQKALGKAPHIPSIRYHLAVALVKNDRGEDAQRELTRLLREHKDFPEANEAETLLAQLQGRQ